MKLNMNIKYGLPLLAMMLSAGAVNAAEAGEFEATEASLQRHQPTPEWMQDGKIGIYFHWGVYSVPAWGNEWYPARMHSKGHKVYKHHQEKYGTVEEFGYHDFVPLFTGEHFDPEEWADLFQKSGAKFAGPVAEHHDGFSMWDSELTPWNAKDMGPKQDILGEMFKALEKRGMKTIATFHHARNVLIKGKGYYISTKGGPAKWEDPKLDLLYGNVEYDKWIKDIWLGKLVEVIDNYRPDVIWFDSRLDRVPESTRLDFCAYYLNAAKEWGKEVSIVRKHDQLPISFTMMDHEKSREPKALPAPWMTDDTLSKGSWSYTTDLNIKTLTEVLHPFIDSVSKNGVLLLNVSPTAQGVIPDEQRKVLLELGAWLNAYGEAIYNTRPWSVAAAEGPIIGDATKGFNGKEDKYGKQKFMGLRYSNKDVCYTASKDGKTVYAFTMGALESGSDIVLRSFKGQVVSEVTTIEGQKVEWSSTEEGLKVTSQGTTAGAKVTLFKINLK